MKIDHDISNDSICKIIICKSTCIFNEAEMTSEPTQVLWRGFYDWLFLNVNWKKYICQNTQKLAGYKTNVLTSFEVIQPFKSIGIIFVIGFECNTEECSVGFHLIVRWPVTTVTRHLSVFCAYKVGEWNIITVSQVVASKWKKNHKDRYKDILGLSNKTKT